jgi:DNA repair exonuclease SbcCD ATPase subunit
MFELARIRVCGFRGFVGEQEFAFDRPVTLLCGENHRGKSSTLNAVEWCLFGDECVGKKTGIRERVGWEIANRRLQKGDVTVIAEFEGPKGTYTVTREQSVSRKRAAQKVTVLLPDGTQLQDDEAENMLLVLFRSSFQDFMTAVYQHQEAIRAILTQEPRERNDAIDRLLGLSPYREILKGITAARLEDIIKGMEGSRETLRKRCEQAIRTLDNLIREEREKAIAEGIPEEAFTEQEALSRAAGIAKAIKSLAEELGAADFKPSVPVTFAEIAEFREWVKIQTDGLWAQAPDVLKQEALATEQQKLVTLKGKYEEAKGAESAAQVERDKFVKQFGDEAALVKDAQQEQQRIGELDDKIRTTNSRARLVQEAIRYLKEVVPEAERGRCPLCGTDKPRLLAHLETEWEQKVKAQVEELERQKEECQSKLEEINSLKDRLVILENNVKRTRSGCEACLGTIAQTLRREFRKEEDAMAILSTRLEQVAREQKSIGEAISKKRAKISDLYDNLGKLRTIDETLRHQQKRTVVERIWETKEFLELEEALNQASQFVEDVRALRTALAEASLEEAESKIHSAQDALDKYFCGIVKHPAIPGLVMEVAEDSRTGLNCYSFKSKDGTDPTPILSQGDLNCLALSLFLGLSEATGDTQRFAFLMLDDPTQSLGPEMKRELVSVLEGIANRRRLIIATPDLEFKNLLETHITKTKVVYDFTDWTDKDGPQVTRTTL